MTKKKLKKKRRKEEILLENMNNGKILHLLLNVFSPDCCLSWISHHSSWISGTWKEHGTVASTNDQRRCSKSQSVAKPKSNSSRTAECQLLWSRRDCLCGMEKEQPPELSGVMQVLKSRVAMADGRFLESLPNGWFCGAACITAFKRNSGTVIMPVRVPAFLYSVK